MIEREVRVISSKTREYSVYLNHSIERYGIEEFKLQIEKNNLPGPLEFDTTQYVVFLFRPFKQTKNSVIQRISFMLTVLFYI
jgi:hypothetical protein